MKTTSATLQKPFAEENATQVRQPQSSRLLSLDLLRGLTIGFMILVNNNGDERAAYWPLKHAAWNGFTPTDLVFPTFLFLVGITTVLSLSSRIEKGVAKAELLGHAVRRAVILYLLGLLVNSFPYFHLHTMRFYGVLPRIAACYLFVAVFYLISPGWRSKAIVAVSALLGYWALMRFVPVPGFGIPTHDMPLLDKDGNLTAWLDRQIFSSSHLYEQTRDPEGLLSTIPALGTALLGMLTGLWLRSAHSLKQKVTGIAAAGFSSVLMGALWNMTFPINKKLWTSSFVLFAGGLSMLLLAACISAVDLPEKLRSGAAGVKQSPLFTPLLVFGTNAISAYVLSELLGSAVSLVHIRRGLENWALLYHFYLRHVSSASFASLLYSLTYVLICWIPIYFLYRRKIFIKI